MYVELKNINKTYGDYKASDNVSFGIEKGKLIGLLGPSGSGKTTILRMIAGLEQPDSGEIIIDGRVVNDVPASERGIGFVFQNYAASNIRLVCTETIDYILKKTEGKTLIFVTHEEQEAVWLKADKTLKFMKDHLIK